MSDFFSGLGGFIKGMQPFMSEEAKNDGSMNAFLLNGELSELKNKKQTALARIGIAVYEEHLKSGGFSEFTELFGEVLELDKQLQRKQQELSSAQDAAEEKKRAEQQQRDAMICKSCGMENTPGTKFCAECGTKLENPSSSFCPDCGAKNPPGTKFCRECGTKL